MWRKFSRCKCLDLNLDHSKWLKNQKVLTIWHNLGCFFKSNENFKRFMIIKFWMVFLLQLFFFELNFTIGGTMNPLRDERESNTLSTKQAAMYWVLCVFLCERLLLLQIQTNLFFVWLSPCWWHWCHSCRTTRVYAKFSHSVP